MPYADARKAREYNSAYRKRWRAQHLEHSRIYEREWKKVWRKEHPEENREYHKAYCESNKDKVVKYRRKADAKRKDDPKRLASRRSYRQHNRVKLRLYERVRFARERTASGTYTAAQCLARIIFYGWCCAYCRTSLTTATLEMDHVIPISKGGTNWPSNLVPACRPCNRRKSDKLWRPRSCNE